MTKLHPKKQRVDGRRPSEIEILKNHAKLPKTVPQKTERQKKRSNPITGKGWKTSAVPILISSNQGLILLLLIFGQRIAKSIDSFILVIK